ncbi:MAG: DUF3037 domain-containing protein [Acidobacteriia bacterium]|jgi:hypothetical protein|nr:DUF3037 domain-containing protein [Terriglobia bacterium]
MSETPLQSCSYRILRYTPNLIRDEWVNIGVLLHDPVRNELRHRLLEGTAELRRVRRLHPQADLELLRALAGELELQIEAANGNPAAFLQRLEETLSNALQLSPPRGVLTEDAAAELERLYRDHVEAPRFRRAAAPERPQTRTEVRLQARHVFRRAGILHRLTTNVSVEEYTEPGDPFRMDFAYRRDGIQGYLHSLLLTGDAGRAKELAYTAERIRAKRAAEFFAITETEPEISNLRHQFLRRLLAAQNIGIVAVTQLERFAEQLRADLN